LSGHTVNITEHGLMVATPSLTPGDVAQWQKRVDRDEPILVHVALNAYPAAPPLKAQVVWTNWAEDEELGPVARIGMLFQVVSGEQREILREILSGLATRPDV
jgi:hypothetical protein